MPQEKMPQVSDKELMMSNTLMIQPEYREEFLMELWEILPQARRLEACISLEVGEVADRPGMFVLSERWRNGNEYLNEILHLPFSGTWNAANHSTQLREQFSSSRQSKWVLCPGQPPNHAADGLKLLVLRSSFFAAADLSRWVFRVM